MSAPLANTAVTGSGSGAGPSGTELDVELSPQEAKENKAKAAKRIGRNNDFFIRKYFAPNC